jgi:hypothetical protein
MSSFSRRRGPVSAKFPTVGTTVSGVVTQINNQGVVPEFVEGRPAGPRFNADGSLFTQVDITVKDADGKESVLHTGGAMFDAIDDALVEAGIDDLVTGHNLSVTYSGDGQASDTDGGQYPPKQYTAIVTPAK